MSLAVEQYERILTIDPDHVQALNNLAYVYHAAADERSLALAERAFELAPEDPTVADTYGWILTERG